MICMNNQELNKSIFFKGVINCASFMPRVQTVANGWESVGPNL